MTASHVRVSPEWLSLREPADAAARAADLSDELTRRLAPADTWVVHDLGAGTGSMGRWLAPRLPTDQHWILHDQDADLLAVAAAHPPAPAGSSTAVTVEVRRSDIAQLKPRDLSGATIITASALLDILTEEDLAGLVSVCARAGCPVLLTLSVAGRVRLVPEDRLDRRVAAAFDAHQRRTLTRGRLLGPDAVRAAVDAFGRLGAEVLVRPSPWRLGPEQGALAAEWLRGWVGAACEQEPHLAVQAADYTRRRLAQAATGRLSVTVDHADLLVAPARRSVGVEAL